MQRSDYDLLSIDEVARTIGQSVKTVRRMIGDGEFPEGFPAPKQLRWQWADVREWVIRRKLLAQIEAAKVVPNRDIPGQSGTTKKPG